MNTSTEKVIEGVYSKHAKADADRRKLRGELAIRAWAGIIASDVHGTLLADSAANIAFNLADAMLAKMEKEGAL